MPISLFNHPLMLAAAAVFAVGVVVYELLNNRQEERRHQYGRRSLPPPPDERPPPPDRKPPPPDRRPPPPDRRLPPPDRKPPPPDRRPPPPDRRPPTPDEKPPPLSSDHTLPPSDQNPPSKSDSFRLLPKSSETSDNSTIIIKEPPNSPCNNLRKRNVHKTLTNDSSLADDSRTSSIADNQNIYRKNFDENTYKKKLLDKLNNEKSVKENLRSKNNLRQNICEEDSDSSDNNLILKCEKKLINHTISNENACAAASKKPFKKKRKSKKAMEKCSENPIDYNKSCSDNSDEAQRKSRSDSFFKDSECSSTNVAKKYSMKRKKCNSHASKNVSDEISKLKHPPHLESKFSETSSSSELSESTTCSEDDACKMEILNALKNDIYGSKENNPDSLKICSPEETKKEEPAEPNVCKACEENPVNTRFHPCNHSYLCVECAVRFRRFSKICVICHQDFDDICLV